MKFIQLSSLEKIFLDEEYENKSEIRMITALGGERVSYQILYIGGEELSLFKVKAEADERIKVVLRTVGNVPCHFTAHKELSDEYYVRKKPGLYPDVLYPLEEKGVYIHPELCHSLFVTCIVPEGMEAGEYSVKITFFDEKDSFEKTMKLKVLGIDLPKQEITYTQWFHADCIASYYRYEIFSDEHWNMIEKFMQTAAYTGINMILTPIFTLPLDTEVGRERPTLQLVDIKRVDGNYSFAFERLKKWINMAKKCGIDKFEMAHFFSQWGTGKTPKIVAKTENGMEKIFGWHVDSDDESYEKFLGAFIPSLVDFLKSEGVYEDTYFHISDEPDVKKDFEIYKKQYEMIEKYINPEKITDAMSHYEFYERGLARKPVVSTTSAEEFLEKKVDNMWVYYCCGPEGGGYSNRFIAMPSGRTRIMGLQLYKYGIDGFLHWGFNFYYERLSRGEINPFMVTDANEAFPAGDAFSVYPGPDGALESLRSVVFYEGLQDNRVCRLLEKYIGKEEVVKIIEKYGNFSFNEYPRNNEEVRNLREYLNLRIEEVLKKN